MTTNARTLEELIGRGVRCDLTQRWIGFKGGGGVRKDLLGIVDIVALPRERGILGIQACVAGKFADHWRLLTVERAEASREWLECGGELEIWSWARRKRKRGGREVWTVRVVPVTLADLTEKGGK